MERISKDQYYLNIAKAVLGRSTCNRRQYGAVIVKNDEIIATGYNGAPRGEKNCCDLGFCKRTAEGHAHNDGDYSSCESVHAEQNAIISASRRDMIGATLYLCGMENGRVIEASPCPVCARLIKNAGIARVVGSKAEKMPEGVDFKKAVAEEWKKVGTKDIVLSVLKHKPAKEMFEGFGYSVAEDDLQFKMSCTNNVTVTVNKFTGDVRATVRRECSHLCPAEVFAAAQMLRELGFNEDGTREAQE